MKKDYKLYSLIAVLFVTVLLTSNITSTKIVQVLGLTFDGGTLLFPLSYIFGDVLTEVYGYKNARKIIWMGFLGAFIMTLTIAFVGALPSSPEWTYQKDYQNILGLTPRLIIASFIAYIAGEFSNSFILAKLKVMMNGKIIIFRLLFSTVIGQFIDTFLFTIIAFGGIYIYSLYSLSYFPILSPIFSYDVILAIFISNYILKVGVELFFSPVTIYIIKKIKKIENEDYYDTQTKFNPFTI